jgi:hypothetical protein
MILVLLLVVLDAIHFGALGGPGRGKDERAALCECEVVRRQEVARSSKVRGR